MTKRLTVALCLVGLLVACSSESGSTVVSGVTSTTQDSAVPPDTSQPSGSETADTSQSTLPDATILSGFQPQYDVFLAAVAEALVGTRFAESSLDDPELFVATGLLFCERLTDGDTEEEVVSAYLTELTGGSPDEADDEQLVLVGTILGAARAALCP